MKEIREQLIQGLNLILLHNLVRPQNITNYVNPEDIREYRLWLEQELDEFLAKAETPTTRLAEVNKEPELSGHYQESIDAAPEIVRGPLETPRDLYNFYTGAVAAQQDMLKTFVQEVQED